MKFNHPQFSLITGALTLGLTTINLNSAQAALIRYDFQGTILFGEESLIDETYSGFVIFQDPFTFPNNPPVQSLEFSILGETFTEEDANFAPSVDYYAPPNANSPEDAIFTGVNYNVTVNNLPEFPLQELQLSAGLQSPEDATFNYVTTDGVSGFGDVTYNQVSVPEPSSIISSLGLIFILATARKFKLKNHRSLK